ncbi:hypothetical protein HPB49_015226 [Dermacentor silvarum]|uniref:Uncharacterized protein n=1 Tax=Dermacentor silvarum TaxID=543639 RepID=A0ACB8C497_DERSI|nr:hypothetical protein HPB49_015226 [Dermacentor silvarum]
MEGTPATDAELKARTPPTPAFAMQKRYHRPSPSQPPRPQPPNAGRPPKPRTWRRKRGQRSPETAGAEEFKVVVRPQDALNLQPRPVHPMNTCTLSTPSKQRALAYLNIRELRLDDARFKMAAYAPSPNCSIRGMLFNAFLYYSNTQILSEVQARNPGIDVVGPRRLGKTRHLLVAVAGTRLSRTLRYLAFTVRLFPFRDRGIACFNCRQEVHRTDACPKPCRALCRRCEDAHPASADGAPPARQPLCMCARADTTRAATVASFASCSPD